MNDKKKVTAEDRDIILRIAQRAVRYAKELDFEIDLTDMEMDIVCVHSVEPLKLTKLLAADNGNFGHDVFGIRSNLNRETEKLENFFSPRFTV